MAEGTVLWFNSEIGEGAIQPDGWISPSMPSHRRTWWRRRRSSSESSVEPVEIYVHYSQIQMRGYKELNAGQRVSFAIERRPNGSLVATTVTPLGPWIDPL
ncbi:cold-shock protein [Prauserella cavernicola]|uniref:Cold-shock protein n=1 Tax=Prauserella cavernicola TaxID=2800127 RepID=A0A934QXJ0_9PSEU|nr:cold shock domain-containing protein [Prauserella cavernicola]MBK1788311.1 cold-shock protein [Prauserella cavernicola]